LSRGNYKIVCFSGENIIEFETLRDFLSANIKARREALNLSQERLAEIADVSVQMIKGIEGRRTWVSDTMLAKLARALGVASFQLLVPVHEEGILEENPLVSGLLRNLKQNIQDDINSQFDRLLSPGKTD
jgi:transcriptional regulator with XRE-family HTH domain